MSSMISTPVVMSAAIPPPTRRHLKALGFARYLASIHVVFGHYFADGFGDDHFMKDFNEFGGTWVPFFFVMSGFVVSYAKFSNPNYQDKTDPLRVFMRKRLTSIYPLFFFSIFLTLIMNIVPYVDGPGFGNLPPGINREQWFSLPFTLLLLHAWSPYLDQCGGEDNLCVTIGAWNLPTWFLCCLLVYWIVWAPLYHFIRKLSLKGVLIGMLLCFLYSFLWPVVFVILGKQTDEDEFYNGGVILEIAKFNPLSFGHIYIWGMLLSRLFVEYSEADLSQITLPVRCLLLVLRYGASVGYLLILLFFSCYGCQKRFTEVFGNLELFFRCGGLLPLHTLIIWGLATEKDPTARLFATYPFTLGELVSYPQYVMQSFVHQFWSSLFRPAWPLTLGYQLSQYLALLCTAYLSAKFVDAPYRAFIEKSFAAKKPPQLLAPDSPNSMSNESTREAAGGLEMTSLRG